VSSLRAAGELLRSVADAGDRMQVSRRLLDVAHTLDQARTGGDESAPSADADDGDVVPIESLAYDAPPEPETAVPIESLAPAPAAEPHAAEPGALETSFRTLERLQRERAMEALEPVAIESLCYRGRSALERAAAVRGALAVELAGASDLATIRPLLQELLDLVPLALDEP
jgi:hypothetical protein